MNQLIISGTNSYKEAALLLKQVESKKFLLVCSSSSSFINIIDYLSNLNIDHIQFNQFTSNPLYDDVCKGVDLFKKEKCDAIIAVGGGSTIDVAKCIKLFCKLNPMQNYLTQKFEDSTIPLIALPTTAGTGSESTRYAVLYYKGNKQSITHDSIMPNYAILDPSVLKTLPPYQKKCTMLDALCQAIESWWSVRSTDESKCYSKIAVELIMQYKDAYIHNNDDKSAEAMMLASNYAGRAINIAQTTAPHAMSYKLSTMYKLPHGHAVAVCFSEVLRYMIENMQNMQKCVDTRGKAYLQRVLSDIAGVFRCDNISELINKFNSILIELGISRPNSLHRIEDIDLLVKSVNPIRLSNNPVALDTDAILNLYERIIL